MITFKQRLHSYQKRSNNALKNFFPKSNLSDNQLLSAMKYSLFSNGKRLRPYLVYSTGEMFGIPVSDLDVPAAAIECIHAYSLTHDDLPVMDNDMLRRGQPSCHIKYGSACAILAGDALQTLAFSILSEQPFTQINEKQRLLMISELARSSGILGMCVGQFLDLAAENKPIDINELELIHSYKSGALIRCAIRLGALSANISEEVSLILDDYADLVGLSFQIRDDILDATENSDQTDVAQKTDLLKKKSTYPSLLGLEHSNLKCNQLYQQALRALRKLEQRYELDTSALKSLASFIVSRNI